MSKRAKTATIHSVDEIPDHFESEDAERDWWGTHEFSPGLLKQMRPRWNEAPDYAPLFIAARDVAQVDAIISSAWLLADLIGKKRDSAEPPELVDFAIGVDVLGATALEAGLNLYLSAPVLYVADVKQRAAAAEQTKRTIERLSVSEKLQLVESASIEGLGPDVFTRARALFEYRSHLVHGSPVLSESSGLSCYGLDFSRDALDATLARFDAVREILKHLRLAPTAS